MYRRESLEHRAAKEAIPEVQNRNSVPIPVDMPMIMNQNEQTFENMAKYITKTADDQLSPKQDLSMAMN